MALFVLSLVIIDVFILGTYTINEGVKHNLGVKLISNRELPEETIGVSVTIIIGKFFYQISYYSLQQRFISISCISVNLMDKIFCMQYCMDTRDLLHFLLFYLHFVLVK